LPRPALGTFPQAGVAAFGRKPPFKKSPLSLRRSAGMPLWMKSAGEAMAIGRTFKESL
jgi:carbamoylphosphate synthase large subunit